MAEAAASIAAAVEGQLKSSAPRVYEAIAMEQNDTLPGGNNSSMVESGTLPPPPSDWSPTSRTSRRSKPPATPLSRLGDLEDTTDRQSSANTLDFLKHPPVGLGASFPSPPAVQQQEGLEDQPQHHQLHHQLHQEQQPVYAATVPTAMHGKGFYYDQRADNTPPQGPMMGHHHQPPPPYHLQQQQHREYNHYPDRMPYGYDHPMPPHQQQHHQHHQPGFDGGDGHQFNSGPPPQHYHNGVGQSSGYGDEASRRRREFEAIAAATTAAHSNQYSRPMPPQQDHHYQPQPQQAAPEADTRAVNEYRRIVHDFVPDAETMSVGNPGGFLDLCAGDVVRVLEVTASGWAAGMRVDEDWRDIPHPQTGSTAWFPYSFSMAIDR
ncbi:hypothetical protein FOZ63_005461 [Perkinsus olseni]|uniref:SH3 domain-containing protein n=1 Tax=Perkinsus olseni TaxID=32597 RepID=A0A7J6P8I0_PEROL|nr:hypothetical protein FOZ63_005461 [Perkinsus olseni]